MVHGGPVTARASLTRHIAGAMSVRLVPQVRQAAEQGCRAPGNVVPEATAQLEPQEQSGPQVHAEQLQVELEQPTPSVQVQVGLQLHGEQVQVGFSQVDVTLMASILSQVFCHWVAAERRHQPARLSRRLAAIRSSRARATRERMVPRGHPQTSAASA